ncbi:DgyrCDS12351 [Dimorphilus gyrociliatus]|uniref:DgyrCDS12351 n=1 Tax=Dimorphilus gyrociliatus TaxID=2664684 RepID=A0A7I8W7H6_9ANNE|nr:DgyrCDS12351 [Dimorphilus gyrociliatus]
MWRWNVSILNLFWIFTLLFWITTVFVVENVVDILENPKFRIRHRDKRFSENSSFNGTNFVTNKPSFVQNNGTTVKFLTTGLLDAVNSDTRTNDYPSKQVTNESTANVTSEGETSSKSPYNSTLALRDNTKGYFSINNTSNGTESKPEKTEYYTNPTQSYLYNNESTVSSRLNKSTTSDVQLIQNLTTTNFVQNETFAKTTVNQLFDYNNTQQVNTTYSTKMNKSFTTTSDYSVKSSVQTTIKNLRSSSNITNSVNFTTPLYYSNTNNFTLSLNQTTSVSSEIFNVTSATTPNLANYTTVTKKYDNITRGIRYPTTPSVSNASSTEKRTDRPEFTKTVRVVSTESIPGIANEFNYTDKINSSMDLSTQTDDSSTKSSFHPTTVGSSTVTMSQLADDSLITSESSVKDKSTSALTTPSNNNNNNVTEATSKQISKSTINPTSITEMFHPTTTISGSNKSDFENSTTLISAPKSTVKPGNVTIDYLQTTEKEEIKTVNTSSSEITTTDSSETSIVTQEGSPIVTPSNDNEFSNTINLDNKTTANDANSGKSYPPNVTPEYTTFSYGTKEKDKVSKTYTTNVNKLQTASVVNFTNTMKIDYSTKSTSYFTSEAKTTVKNIPTTQQISVKTLAASSPTTKVDNGNYSFNYQTSIKDNLKKTTPNLNYQSTQTAENDYTKNTYPITIPNSPKNSITNTKTPIKPTDGSVDSETLTVIVVGLLTNEKISIIKTDSFLNGMKKALEDLYKKGLNPEEKLKRSTSDIKIKVKSIEETKKYKKLAAEIVFEVMEKSTTVPAKRVSEIMNKVGNSSIQSKIVGRTVLKSPTPFVVSTTNKPPTTDNQMQLPLPPWAFIIVILGSLIVVFILVILFIKRSHCKLFLSKKRSRKKILKIKANRQYEEWFETLNNGKIIDKVYSDDRRVIEETEGVLSDLYSPDTTLPPISPAASSEIKSPPINQIHQQVDFTEIAPSERIELLPPPVKHKDKETRKQKEKRPIDKTNSGEIAQIFQPEGYDLPKFEILRVTGKRVKTQQLDEPVDPATIHPSQYIPKSIVRPVVIKTRDYSPQPPVVNSPRQEKSKIQSAKRDFSPPPFQNDENSRVEFVKLPPQSPTKLSEDRNRSSFRPVNGPKIVTPIKTPLNDYPQVHITRIKSDGRTMQRIEPYGASAHSDDDKKTANKSNKLTEILDQYSTPDRSLTKQPIDRLPKSILKDLYPHIYEAKILEEKKADDELFDHVCYP